MKNSNYVAAAADGFKIFNGNAQSVKTYETAADAETDSALDTEAYASASDAAEAQEVSPVEWE